MKKILLCAAMAMLALVGCEKAVQSELSFDDVKQFATVSGSLVGYVDVPGQATVKSGLGGIRVYVEVANSEYKAGAQGNALFEAKTAEDGSFEIKVKVGSKAVGAGGVAPKLKWDDFNVEIGGKKVYFLHNSINLDNLNAGDVRVAEHVAAKDAVLNSTVGEADLQGVLTYDAGAIKKEDGTREEITHAFAADVQVSIAVVYFAGQPEEVTKTFIAKTDKDGKFAFKVPVEANGNNLDIDIAQFKANYTKFANNQWTTVECFYTLAAPVPAAVKANEITIQDVVANVREEIDPAAKTQVSFVVKGVLEKMIEKGVKDKDDNITNYVKGTKAVEAGEYSFTIRLDYYGNPADPTEVTSKILYEGLKVNGDKGAFSHTVKLYDGWDIANVKVVAYADKTSKVEAFEHFYLPFDSDSKKFNTYKDGWKKQGDVKGIYKGGKDNVLASAWATDNQLFFDLDLGTLVLDFEAESNLKLIGVECKPAEGELCSADKNGLGAGFYPKANTVDVDGVTYSKGISGLAW